MLESSRLVQIHNVDGQVYRVYARSVCWKGFIIYRSENEIRGSCVCNKKILLAENRIVLLSLDGTSRKLWKCFDGTLTSSTTHFVYRITSTAVKLVELASMKQKWTVDAMHSKSKLQLANYLWELYSTQESVMMSLWDLDGKRIADFPVAKAQSGSSTAAQLVATNEGAVVSLSSSMVFVSLKSVLIGDISNGIIPLNSKSLQLAFNQSMVYSWDRENRQIMQLEGTKFTPVRGILVPPVTSRVLFAVSGKKLEFSPKSLGKTVGFAVDLRKNPQKFVFLDKNQIRISVNAEKVKYLGKLEHQRILSVHRVPEISLTVFSTENGILCSGEPLIPLEPDLISCGMLNGEFIAVYPTEIVMHNRKVATDLILEASISSSFVVLRHIDSIRVWKSFEGDFDQEFHGTSTFIHLHNSRLVMGFYGSGEDMTRYKIPGPQIMHTTVTSVDLNSNKTTKMTFNQVVTSVHFFNNDSFIAIFNGEGPVYAFNNGKYILREISGPLKIGFTCGDVAVLIGNGVFAATTQQCIRLYDSQEKMRSYVSSACHFEKGIFACVCNQSLRYFSTPLLGFSQLPITLKSIDLPSIDRNTFESDYHMCIVPSKRLLILYSGTVCNFYDSTTLEPLLVSGLHIQWCSCIVVWEFLEFEHIIFADGLGSLQSYVLKRHGQKVDCSIKYRASAFAVQEHTPQPETLLTANENVYFIRRHQLARLVPAFGLVQNQITLSGITGACCVLSKFIVVGHGDSVTLLSDSLSGLKSFSLRPFNVTVLAASAIKGPEIIIICRVERKDYNIASHALIFYDIETEKHRVVYPQFKQIRNNDLAIRSVQISPGYEDKNWEKNDFIKAYCLMNDYRVEERVFKSSEPQNFSMVLYKK